MKTTDPKEFFTQYLKRNKYRITPERFEILETVLHCDGHFDADELYLRIMSVFLSRIEKLKLGGPW